jgi:hypothetical protein
MAETLKLQTNIPETISLAFQNGRTVSGNYGDQIMFTLEDGRKIYLDPWEAEKVDALQLGRGELFTIVKRERQIPGGRKTKDLEAWRGAAQGPQPSAPQAPAPRSVPSTPRNGITAQVSPQQEHQQPTTAAPDRLTQELTASVGASRIELALCAAVDAAAKAEEYAKERGLSIRFGPEDVRAMGLSLFIAMDRGGNSWRN